MTTADLDAIKDIPGYKAILKTVLKSQIQQLVELLASGTDEESVFLTASVSDGTLSHLGSDSGKGFLEGHEDIKSQFLGFCLKDHHKKQQEQDKAEEAAKQAAKSQPRPSPHTGLRGRGHRGRPPLTSQRRSLPRSPGTRHEPRSPGTRHEPYPVSRPIRVPSPSNLSNPAKTVKPAATVTHDTNDMIKIEPLLDTSNAGSITSANVGMSIPSSQSLHSSTPRSSIETKSKQISESADKRKNAKVSQPQPSTSTDTVSELPADDNAVSEQSSANSRLSSGIGLGTDSGETLAADNDKNVDSKSEVTMDPNVSVKVEAISEADMELEITGVEMGSDDMHSEEQDYGWNPDEQGYDMSGATGTDGDMAAGNDGYSTDHSDTDHGLEDSSVSPPLAESVSPPLAESVSPPLAKSSPKKAAAAVGGISIVYETCGKSYRSIQGLNDHRLMVHGEGASCFTCTYPGCGQKFRSRTFYNSHMFKHTNEKAYMCSECGKTYVHKKDLNNHTTAMHAGEIHRCACCDKSFKYKRSLDVHVKATHLGKSIICEHCGKVFSYQTNLMRHINKSHKTGVQKKDLDQLAGAVRAEVFYRCETCGKPFRSKKGLGVHVKAVHEGKTVICQHCGKVFSHQSNLTKHVRRKHEK